MINYLITSLDPFFGVSIIRVEEDRTEVSLGLGEEDPGYLLWIEEGNTPKLWSYDGL